jgi:hypothetical protein
MYNTAIINSFIRGIIETLTDMQHLPRRGVPDPGHIGVHQQRRRHVTVVAFAVVIVFEV